MKLQKHKKNNDGKYKFPVEIKGDLELPDLEIEDNFNNGVIKEKISSIVEEVKKINRKKCQSSQLM